MQRDSGSRQVSLGTSTVGALMSEKCPLCGQTDRPLFGALYIRAFSEANKSNQTTGEKRDLFITLEQLHRIMFDIQQEESRPATRGR